jgi:hypothetical protein
MPNLNTMVFAESSFAGSQDVTVNFGSNADRGLLLVIFNEGNTTPGGTSISSAVIDPGGAALSMTLGTEQSGGTIFGLAGKYNTAKYVGASTPTGGVTVRVTMADGNGKPRVWALPVDDVTAISADARANASSTTPSVTISSATSDVVVGFVSVPGIGDGITISPTSPATAHKRVLNADCANIGGSVWQEAGVASVTIDGTFSTSQVWAMSAYSLTGGASGPVSGPNYYYGMISGE